MSMSQSEVRLLEAQLARAKARLAEAERMQKIAQDQSESIGNQYAALQALLAEAERLLATATDLDREGAAPVYWQEWLHYVKAFLRAADSADVQEPESHG